MVNYPGKHQGKLKMIPVNNYLIVQVVGNNRPNIISELSRAFVNCGCNLLNTKLNILGNDLAVHFFLSGNWGAIAKMEATLPSLEQKLSLSIQARRTTEPSYTHSTIAYTIQVTAIDKPGILNGIAEFLYSMNIPIEEISAYTYTPHTNTRMVSLLIKINIPDTTHLATFREQFMNYCDDNNLDSFLEPARNI